MMMEIVVLDGLFSVCQVRHYSTDLFDTEICFACQTDEEKSLVCPERFVPKECVVREDGWCGFRIRGLLDFSLLGIIANISALLAENKISIFVVSTYRTDYFFVKKESFDQTKRILREAGYILRIQEGIANDD